MIHEEFKSEKKAKKFLLSLGEIKSISDQIPNKNGYAGHSDKKNIYSFEGGMKVIFARCWSSFNKASIYLVKQVN